MFFSPTFVAFGTSCGAWLLSCVPTPTFPTLEFSPVALWSLVFFLKGVYINCVCCKACCATRGKNDETTAVQLKSLTSSSTASLTTDTVDVNAFEKENQRPQGDRRKFQCGKCGSWYTRQQPQKSATCVFVYDTTYNAVSNETVVECAKLT